jgi:hypothetical protein
MTLGLICKEASMQTLNEMLSRHLLSHDQHADIRTWIAKAGSPEAILNMPPHLWRSLELASVLMGVDSDLTQAAQLGE